MTDAAHKRAITEATEAFNKAIDDARREGLRVGIRVSKYQAIDQRFENQPFLLDCAIMRPI